MRRAWESTFDLVIELADNFSPQVFDVSVFLDGEKGAGGAYAETTLAFPISGLPDGEHTIVVEAGDEDGNLGSDEVTFVVGVPDEDGDGETGDGGGDDGDSGAGDGEADPGDEDGGDDSPSASNEGCGCMVPTRGRTTAAWIVPVLLGLRRPRRSLGTSTGRR